MAEFLVRSNLGRGDLRLFLNNLSGYPQDAVNVRWTVFALDGRQVSGKNLPAIKATIGEYYAPWFADTKNGNYRVEWIYQDDWGLPVRKAVEQFFVLDPSAYQCCPVICPGSVPVPGGGSYLVGTLLGQGDLPLFIKNADGFPANPFAIFWTIVDCRGCPITPRTIATQADTGEFYARWLVNACGGEYTIRWEFMQDSDSPLESRSQNFSVLNPNIFLPCNGFTLGGGGCCSTRFVVNSVQMTCGACRSCQSSPCQCSGCSTCHSRPCHCSPGCRIQFPCTFAAPFVPVTPVQTSCCTLEIPRTIHLAPIILPAGGPFTDQPFYLIPAGIHHVTFYVTYTRGAPGGFPVMHLLWGNGTEEVQETLIDTDITIVSPNSTQNLYLQDLFGPAPLDNNPVNFTIYARIPGGSTTVRLIAAEKGQPGAPGTISITLTASS